MSECEEVDCTIYRHYHWVLALSLGLPGHVLVEVPHCLLLLVVQQDMSTTFHDLHSQLRTAVLQVPQLVHDPRSNLSWLRRCLWLRTEGSQHQVWSSPPPGG